MAAAGAKAASYITTFYTIVVVESFMISSCIGDCVGIIISAMMIQLLQCAAACLCEDSQ
jgi:hypothetical protein